MSEIIQPPSADEVAAALRRASDARQSIVIRGAGTKSDWGRPAGRIDAILDMRRMNRVLAHEHGDMTATIEAGATLREANQTMAVHGQTLPLDPPFADQATIGGLLATNDSGPLRHRYGTPRDLVIGMRIATADGVLAKAGGQVVKNVAGYDLSKLVTGSFGSLAAIVSATFKLAPLPAASKTLIVIARDAAAVADIVRTVMASQLEPVAFEICSGTGDVAAVAFRVLLRFASLPAVVDAQIEQAIASLKACASSVDVLDGDAERARWHEHATRMWNEPGVIVRASWLPADLAAGLDELDGIRASPTPVPRGASLEASVARSAEASRYAQTKPALKACAVIDLIGRAAVGSGLVRIDGDTDAQASAVERLRASRVFGNVVIVRGSPALKARVDVWGSPGDRRPLFESLKRAFDPHGILNAGRGPL